MPKRPESQSAIYRQNKPRVTVFRVNSRFTNMTKTFGDQLQDQLNAKKMRAAELARRSGVTKQGIGRLLNNTPHSITGAPPQPERETVEKIADALGWDLNEALLAAGYAPEGSDILRLIDAIGFQDWERFTPEQKEEMLRTVRRVAAGMLSEREDE